VQYGSAEMFYDQIKDVCARAQEQGVDLSEEAFTTQPHVFHNMSPLTAKERGGEEPP